MDKVHLLKPTDKPKYQDAYLVQSSATANETVKPKKARTVRPPEEVIKARDIKASKFPKYD
tara:strand:+ start:389 stop:571 length:183 start_codon:yes stop_codon:yes gene_type:complete